MDYSRTLGCLEVGTQLRKLIAYLAPHRIAPHHQQSGHSHWLGDWPDLAESRLSHCIKFVRCSELGQKSGERQKPTLLGRDVVLQCPLRSNAVIRFKLSGRYFGLIADNQAMQRLRCPPPRRCSSTSSTKPCPGSARHPTRTSYGAGPSIPLVRRPTGADFAHPRR